ncbi:MAG: GldG family protein [Gammaproteobacteria bacterium]|nr:GldG family protein [Gammaproteobacteria bacterium]
MKAVLKPRSRRWQNVIFYLLFALLLGVLAWLSTVYSWQWDLSRDGRNSLSQTSVELLQTLSEPVQVTVYLGPDEVTRKAIQDLISRYQRLKADISLTFINPETSPALARELGIAQGGELFIDYQQRQQRLQRLDERSFSNALLRLAQPEQSWLVFIEGHGERDPLGKANFDYFELGRRLQARGFQLQRLNLITQPQIPDNTNLLVLASPQSAYLPGEVALLQSYLQRGGNLLWLSEPNSDDGLQRLATELDLERLPGGDCGCQWLAVWH